MSTVTGSVVDERTGARIEARVQVLDSTGSFTHPSDAILKVGTGDPFFYSDGSFSVEVPRGKTRIAVERGTEYVPADVTIDAPSRGAVTIDVALRRWSTLADGGWHPGNTHIHYDENEERPDDRLRLDPRIEDLRMTAVSILRRRRLDYATNKYPPGMLTEMSSPQHHVQCGQENRHNSEPWEVGYGHVMLLNVRSVVDPVSRGVLVDDFDPDYPPLSYACDDARRQGGLVIWCHNGRGMEAPVAAALGKLDAFNLFDPYWNDAEYDIYYRMLNAGLRLPASTGSDWFICSANRVYVQTGGEFDYETWVGAMRRGKTFITNGPALHLSVDGQGPGEEIAVEAGRTLEASVSWESHHTLKRVELVQNGAVIAAQSFEDGSTGGQFKADVSATSNGWVAARAASDTRDSFAQPIFAHTSPVYLISGVDGPEKKDAAVWLDGQIERSLEWVRTKGRFYTDKQRREVVDLFRQGQEVYRSIAGA